MPPPEQTQEAQLKEALCQGVTQTEALNLMLRLMAKEFSPNNHTVIRNMDVTSSDSALPNVPGKLVSIHNRTGGELTIHRADSTGPDANNIISDDGKAAYYVNSNANELIVSSDTDGRIEIGID